MIERICFWKKSVLISQLNIKHVPGIVLHVCLRGKNIAGWHITRGYRVRTVHGVRERLAEHYRRRPMWKRGWYSIGHERVPRCLTWVGRVANVRSVRVIVAVVTVTVTHCPALGGVDG